VEREDVSQHLLTCVDWHCDVSDMPCEYFKICS